MTAEREALERELRAHVAGMQCAIDNCGISQKEWDTAAKYAMDNIGEWKRLLSEYAAHLSRAAEPVYQARATDDSWWDVSEELYVATSATGRRILYTHPPEPARDAKDILLKLRGCLQQINEDTGGDNYLNLSCDGLDMIDAAMAQESGE